MSQTIDIGYKASIATINLNEKFVEVLGRNGIFKGFNIVPGTGLTVNINSGTDDCSVITIDGAKIKETSAINGVLIAPNVSGSLRTDILYAIYNQTTRPLVSPCAYIVATGPTSILSIGTTCKIAEIDVPSGASSILLANIRPEVKLLSLSALDTKINTTATNAANALISHVANMHVVATSTLDGLMAKADKVKFDTIATGAEVNQLAWSTVSIKKTDATLTLLTSDAKTDTLYVEALDGIDFAPDATNNKYGIKVVLTDTAHGARSGALLHAVATQAVNGFMSSVDKIKSDSVATGAEVNQFAFSKVTDGTITTSADTKTDTLRVRSSNLSLTVAVADNDPTYGNELLLTLNNALISHTTLLPASLLTDDHTQYMHNSSSRTVSAVHTYNPIVAGPAFILGVNAADELINGLNADTLDSQEGSFYQDAGNLNAGLLPPARFDDAAHGTRAGLTLHAVVTQANNGFMASTDKLKVDRIKAGTSTFSGSGKETTIAHGLSYIPVYRDATPIGNPGGYLGEVWVRADITNIYVGNTGTYVGAFQWFVM